MAFISNESALVHGFLDLIVGKPMERTVLEVHVILVLKIKERTQTRLKWKLSSLKKGLGRKVKVE